MSEVIEHTIRQKLASIPAGAVNTLRGLLGEEVWALLRSPSQDAKSIKEWGCLRVVGKTDRNHLIYQVR